MYYPVNGKIKCKTFASVKCETEITSSKGGFAVARNALVMRRKDPTVCRCPSE